MLLRAFASRQPASRVRASIVGVTLGTISDLAATAGVEQVVLDWTAPTGATGQQPQYKETTSETWLDFGSALAGDAITVTVTGLTASTAYDFRVSATDGVATTYSNEVEQTPTASGVPDWLGSNAPAGMKSVFIIDGTTTDIAATNDGIITSGAISVGARWDLTGSLPITEAGNRVEAVADAKAIVNGYALRKHFFNGDTDWCGSFLGGQTAWRNWTPPGWSGPVGLPKKYYVRYRLWGSDNFYLGPAGVKVGGYIGTSTMKSAFIAVLSSTILFASQDNQDPEIPWFVFDTAAAAWNADPTTPIDVEVVITCETSEGAADGSVLIYINGTLAYSETGRQIASAGLEGGQFPFYWNGQGADAVSGLEEGESMYVAFDILGIAAIEE